MLHADVECFPSGDPVPILDSSSNQTTVEGEYITFICIFEGNYSPINYDAVFWIATFQNGSKITIQDDSNFSDYHIETKRSCPPTNYACCHSTTKLSIHTSLPLTNTMITCTILYDSIPSSTTSNLSELYFCNIISQCVEVRYHLIH